MNKHSKKINPSRPSIGQNLDSKEKWGSPQVEDTKEENGKKGASDGCGDDEGEEDEQQGAEAGGDQEQEQDDDGDCGGGRYFGFFVHMRSCNSSILSLLFGDHLLHLLFTLAVADHVCLTSWELLSTHFRVSLWNRCSGFKGSIGRDPKKICYRNFSYGLNPKLG